MAETTPQKPSKSVPNRSLRRKQAARLTAIRALYAQHFREGERDVTLDAWVDTLIADQQEAIANDDDETAFKDAPERAMLLTLLESASQHAPAIAKLIQTHMGEKWNMARMGPLLQAILHIAIAELMARQDKNAGIIISEYVLLTEAYFDDSEVSFVNGILAAIAKSLRT